MAQGQIPSFNWVADNVGLQTLMLIAEGKQLFQLFLGKAVRKVPALPTNGLGTC